MQVRKVDRKWFEAKCEKRYGSARSLTRLADELPNAAGAPMHRAALTRLLNGESEPTVPQVLRFAELFGVSLQEVVRRLGYRLAKG